MKKKKILKVILRIFLVLFTTVLLLAGAVVGVVYVILCGPSLSAQELLTRSLKETSAMGFVPDLFLSEERINEIMVVSEEELPAEEIDTSLVTIAATQQDRDEETSGGTAVEEEEDIEFVEITGASYRGIMMIVKDPTRLFVGTPDRFGDVGLTLEEMVEKYDAVGGVNGGGFYDPNGSGEGGIPTGIVITNGEMTYGNYATYSSVIGFDADGILHVGNMTGAEAQERNLQWACSFGPALVINGEASTDPRISSSGVNPRTAVGQRADGAVLLLVVDGRQVTSLGATFEDLISIMLEHGAVNASNLDGGSSSQMIYNDETLNINASVIGLRPLPTTFLVSK